MRNKHLSLVRKTSDGIVMTINEALAAREGDPWNNATDRAKKTAELRYDVVTALNSIISTGLSGRRAIGALERSYRNGRLGMELTATIAALTKSGRSFISEATLFEWLALTKEAATPREARAALLPKHKGRVRKNRQWEGVALDIYHQPSKPTGADVQRRLVRAGHECTVGQVRGLIDSMPAQLGRNSAARLGQRLYSQTEAPYTEMDNSGTPPGFCYVADGYRADVYLAHPLTGGIWRPEIMHIVDEATGFMVGFHIMAHESAYDVMVGWAKAFEKWDHVPPIRHVDNGSGFRNRFTEDSVTSYLDRVCSNAIYSRPYNPKGKGIGERINGISRDGFMKLWIPPFYCGPDMAKEVLERTARECRAKNMIPPSLSQFLYDYQDWIDNDWNQRPSNNFLGKTRAEAWATRIHIPPNLTAAEIARPQVRRTVRRGSVNLIGRRYQSHILLAFNHKQVIVEYDITDSKSVTIRNEQGRFVCDAPLVEKKSRYDESFVEEKTRKALEASIKRLDKKREEKLARAGLIIEADVIAESAIQFLPDMGSDRDDDEPMILDLTNPDF